MMAIFDGDRDKLGAYVRHLADLMGLCAWTITLMDGDPDDDNHGACAQAVYGRQVLNLWFRDGWQDWEPEILRSTTAHELLQGHLNPLTHGTLNNLAEWIGKAVYSHAWEAMTEQLELTCDRIATVWAETLPLPIAYAEHVEVGGEIEEAA